MAELKESKSVYIIDHEDDRDEVKKIVELLEKENFKCERQSETHPGTTHVTGLDEALEEYDTILLILSKHAEVCEWIHYCQAVLADRKHTVPLIVDPDLKIADLDPSIQRLVCLKTSDDDYRDKLCKSLRSGGEYCLPVAPIHPGICIKFFYGFLDIVLPDFDRCLQRWQDDLNNKKGSSIRVVPKMLVIVPESCKCKEKLGLYAPELVKLYPDDDGSTVTCAKNPLDASRCYDQHVYEITNPDDPSEKYYAVLVLCATMHALYEMKQDGESGIDQEKMEEERRAFEDMLATLLQKHAHCANKGDVVSFDDRVNETDMPRAFVTPIIEKCREIMKDQKSA